MEKVVFYPQCQEHFTVCPANAGMAQLTGGMQNLLFRGIVLEPIVNKIVDYGWPSLVSRALHHIWSSMARQSYWLLERHVSEKDELENQKLSHTHLYPVSQIIMCSVASFDSRTPPIVVERSWSPILAPTWECRCEYFRGARSRRVCSKFMVITYGA